MGILVRLFLFQFVAISALWFAPDNALARGGGGHGSAGHHHSATSGSRIHFVFRTPQRRVAIVSGGISSGLFIGNNVVTSGRRFSKRTDGAGLGGFGWGWDWGWDGGDYPSAPVVTAPGAPVAEAALPPQAPVVLPPCRENVGGVTIVRGKSCRT